VVLYTLPRTNSDLHPPTCTSCVAAIISIHHYTQLVYFLVSHYVAQAGLELQESVILLPQAPK
jgi:hypothetical protein